jgi:hypothetical protein
MWNWLLRRRRRRARQVHSLARDGHAPAAIARRTGLSRDAVALALTVGSERRILPAPARIAGKPSATGSFGDAMQVAVSNPLESLPEEWSRPARALPRRRVRILPRFG